MILSDLFTFLGRLHPMVVHLPIGFLLIAGVFQVFSYFPKYRSLREAVSLTLLAGFLASVAAGILGYMLSLKGDYDPELLSHHRFAGILLALTAGILWSLTTPFYSRFFSTPAPVITTLCILVIGLTGYTGHQGGNLTHGNNYLSLETLTHQERVKPAKAEEALVFEDVIQPLLERRCTGCHQPGKRKGELVMTSYEALMKGGKHGKVIAPGKPAESELYRRITLDPDHEDFMPTDGKTPLTKTEKEVIRWWIAKAGAAQQKKVTTISEHESMLPLIASVLELPGAAPLPEDGLATTHPVNPSIPAKTNMAAVASLRQKGLTIRVMLHTPVMLDVTLPAQSGITISRIAKDLDAVAGNVIWLNVADNNLTEKDLTIVKKMTNLEKLRLDKNTLGDGVADLIMDLKHLEAVNLNETRLSNAGLARLQKIPSLKRIYTWKTAVQGSEK